MDKDTEQLKKELWVKVYVAYVESSNSTISTGAAKWADVAVDEFVKRFDK